MRIMYTILAIARARDGPTIGARRVQSASSRIVSDVRLEGGKKNTNNRMIIIIMIMKKYISILLAAHVIIHTTRPCTIIL